jgi:hypothetical protein
MDDLDLRRLADIPDPFSEPAARPPRSSGERPLAASPSRAHVRGFRLLAVAIALVSQAAWLALVEHRNDMTASSPGALLLGMAIPLAAAAVALSAAARPGALGLGESLSRLSTLLPLSLAVFVTGTLFVAQKDAEVGSFWNHAARCMAVSAVLAAAPLALGVWSFRHAFAAAAPWRCAGLGVAAGALAAATMSLACSNGGALHVLAGHGAMMLAGGVVGAALGRATRA